MAYSLVEPFGEDWRQTAELCATQLNCMGGKKSGGAFRASDMHFMPRLETPEELAAVEEARAWRAYGNRFRGLNQQGAAVS